MTCRIKGKAVCEVLCTILLHRKQLWLEDRKIFLRIVPQLARLQIFHIIEKKSRYIHFPTRECPHERDSASYRQRKRHAFFLFLEKTYYFVYANARGFENVQVCSGIKPHLTSELQSRVFKF